MTGPLSRILSDSRLAPYLRRTSGETDAVALYLWNVSVSEALYPVLQFVEVSLRNRLHEAIGRFVGRRWLSDGGFLQRREQDAVQSACGQTARPPGNIAEWIIPELSFGFWTGLLGRACEPRLWPSLLRTVFPGIPRRSRTRKAVARRFHDVRLLRNRVSHHEPVVWGPCRPQDLHSVTVETLFWLAPELEHFWQRVGQLPAVVGAGPDAHRSLAELALRRGRG